ncbi:MAG TPA: STAS domain-containing protein [Solirubrobacteraceae bacterium]|nr:STAS domain-containing protein [Solirubrobacteraceae bacterium]
MRKDSHGAVPSLVVVHAHTDDADVLSLVGDLDLASAPRFVSQAAEALRGGAKRLFVELDGVPFVDSAGLAALLNVLRRATAARAGMVLIGAQPQVRNLLAQTRLEREFHFAASIDDAAGAL